MITTLEPVLIEVSGMLNEISTDISVKRIGYLNRAFNYVLSQHKWSARRKPQVLTVAAGVTEYDLTSSLIITDGDYDAEAGVFELYNGTTRVDPCAYDNRTNYTNNDFFSLSPDGKKLVLTKSPLGSEVYTLWYYAKHVTPVSHTTTLKLALPDSFLIPLATYTKHLVHDGRRQRNDSRNCLIDVQEQLADLKFADAKHKVKDLPRIIQNPFSASRFRRNYRF